MVPEIGNNGRGRSAHGSETPCYEFMENGSVAPFECATIQRRPQT
jgi:hypothetical protein